MYEIKVISEFSASHHLRDYGGKCEKAHGHNWKVEVICKGENLNNIQICFYAVPYGVVPEELAQTFPLSQFEITEPADRETLEFVTEQVGLFIEESNYPKVVLLSGNEQLDYLIQRRCEEAIINNEKALRIVSNPQPWSDRALREVVTAIEYQ